MKKVIVIVLMLSVGRLSAQDGNNQLKVMLEQIAKLQSYLMYLQKGYDIVHRGLTTIGDIKKGDLDLHQSFFDRLKTVSPVIKKYYKTADILVRYQQMQKSVQAYTREFVQSGMLTGKEQTAVAEVFAAILRKMENEVDRLETVITDRSLTMSDAERLDRIDVIHGDAVGLFRELYNIGCWVQAGILQRKSEKQSLKQIEPLY